VFGGWNGTEQNNDLFTFNFVTQEWARVTPRGKDMPLARCSHCIALNSEETAFYIFGGYGGRTHDYLDDLWQFSFVTMSWTLLGRLSPRSRMKMVQHHKKLYIYGGWNSKVHFSDFMCFDLVTHKWRDVSQDHPPGEGKMGQYSMVIHESKLFMFGGFNDKDKTSTNDMQAFRLSRPSYSPCVDMRQCV